MRTRLNTRKRNIILRSMAQICVMACRVCENGVDATAGSNFSPPSRVVALWSRVRKTDEATYLRVVFASDRQQTE
jgi:hypothetical protein